MIMKRVIVAPDSFKGTLTAMEVSTIMSAAILALDETIEVITIPIADGGEGTVEAILLATGGEKKPVKVQGPRGELLDAVYGWLPDKSAVVETAMSAGLPLMGDSLDVMNASTYGVGEMIGHAIQNGTRRIYLGLGGSATNDGGCGAAAALGVRFLKHDGQVFIPVGRTLIEIDHIDIRESRVA